MKLHISKEKPSSKIHLGQTAKSAILSNPSCWVWTTQQTSKKREDQNLISFAIKKLFLLQTFWYRIASKKKVLWQYIIRLNQGTVVPKYNPRVNNALGSTRKILWYESHKHNDPTFHALDSLWSKPSHLTKFHQHQHQIWQRSLGFPPDGWAKYWLLISKQANFCQNHSPVTPFLSQEMQKLICYIHDS